MLMRAKQIIGRSTRAIIGHVCSVLPYLFVSAVRPAFLHGTVRTVRGAGTWILRQGATAMHVAAQRTPGEADTPEFLWVVYKELAMQVPVCPAASVSNGSSCATARAVLLQAVVVLKCGIRRRAEHIVRCAFTCLSLVPSSGPGRGHQRFDLGCPG